MLKKIIKKTFCCECCAFVVPSGTIKEVMPTGTITVKLRVFFLRRRNLKPRYYAKNPLLQKGMTMYEPRNKQLAETRRSACVALEYRPSQRTDAERPVEAGRPLDGHRVANSPQPAAGEGKSQRDAAAELVDICETGSRNLEHLQEPRPAKRMETVGDTSSLAGEPIHSESKADLATIPRPTGEVNTENVMLLLEYQQYRCALTGRKLTPQVAALDHIVPIRFDGEHIIANVQVLHKDVNRAKGSLTSAEFIHMCKEVVDFLKSKTNRPGSPVCGDPEAVGAVGRTETAANLRKTKRGIDPKTPSTKGDL